MADPALTPPPVLDRDLLPDRHHDPAAGKPRWPVDQPFAWAFALWEPLRHYRRTGEMHEDTEAWFAALSDPGTPGRLRALGVNVVTTRFFKGFGLEAERAEIEETKRFVANCHAAGVRVLLYVQLGSVVPETLGREVPDAGEWFARRADGSAIEYGHHYFRVRPCRSHPGFLGYLDRVIEAAVRDAGGDGVWLDNPGGPPCYCDRCKGLFRGWLQERHAGMAREEIERRFGFDDFRTITLPNRAGIAGRDKRRWIAARHRTIGGDPLVQAWVEFHGERFVRLLARIRAVLDRSNRDAAIGMNTWRTPGIYRPIALEAFSRLVSVGYVEDEKHARVGGDGRIVNRIGSFKAGRALGVVLAGSEGPFHDDRIPSPPPALARLHLAESLAFGASTGVSSLLMRVRGRFSFEDERLLAARRPFYELQHRRADLFVGSREAGRVAVWRSARTLAFDFERRGADLLGSLQALVELRIPFRVAFDRDLLRIEDEDCLVLPNADAMSGQQCEIVRRFVRRGGGLVAWGETSLYDERKVRRTDLALRDVFGAGFFDAPADPHEIVRAAHGPGRSAYFRSFFPGPAEVPEESDEAFPVPADFEVLRRAIEAAKPRAIEVEVSGPGRIAVESCRAAGGRRVIHLVKYDNETPAEGLALRVWFRARSASLVTAADPAGRPLEFREGALPLPAFDTYAAVVLG